MQTKPQLFCFTHAGGNADFFNEIAKDLTSIDLIKFEYSGHGSRYKEPFYQNIQETVADLYPKLKESFTGGRYALFGYSMGSIVLAEMLQTILAKGEICPPDTVFISSHGPHTKSELADFSDCELDEQVKERTIKFGAVPENLVNNKVFWRTYLPMYRADYAIIGRYSFEDLSLRTNIPATVFYSETDTPLSEMVLWENYFTGDISYCKYEGNHFFITKHHKKMAEEILKKMGE